MSRSEVHLTLGLLFVILAYLTKAQSEVIGIANALIGMTHIIASIVVVFRGGRG